jgi:hypothetical protein
MFHAGFEKTAVTTVNLTPEEYFELAREKDPYVASLGGAAAGAAVGALKSRSGRRASGALVGAAAGAAAGGAGGHVLSKGLRRYQANKVRQYTEELNLRALPHKGEGRGHRS